MPQTTTFGNLEIAFDGQVLAPRSWTLLQAEWAAELLDGAPPGPVLELCAGVGHLGLVAVARHPRRLVCVDASPVACFHARRNAAVAGLGDRVEVRPRDLTDAAAADERFALVIADPPWVPSAEVDQHPDDPVGAIDGGPDGLDPARVCVRVASEHLLPGGSILLQLGTRGQAAALAAELTGLDAVEVREGEGGVVVLLQAAS